MTPFRDSYLICSDKFFCSSFIIPLVKVETLRQSSGRGPSIWKNAKLLLHPTSFSKRCVCVALLSELELHLCQQYYLDIQSCLVCVQSQRVPTVKNGFKQGMKLEGIDPQHPSMYFVLTVAEVSQASINGQWLLMAGLFRTGNHSQTFLMHNGLLISSLLLLG